MADEHDDDQDLEGQDDDGQVQLSARDLRALRKASKERVDLQSQLQSKDRELAFARAKLDFDDPRLKYFIKAYDGELTAEAIREQAEADGFLQKPQSTKPDDRQAHQRMAAASSGANETAAPELGDLIRQASSPEEVMKLCVQAGLPTIWNRSED